MMNYWKWYEDIRKDFIGSAQQYGAQIVYCELLILVHIIGKDTCTYNLHFWPHEGDHPWFMTNGLSY